MKITFTGRQKCISVTVLTVLIVLAVSVVLIVEGSKNTKTVNGIEFVLVKAGTFTMGVAEEDDLVALFAKLGLNYSFIRQHEVTLTQDFWISKYPITQAQFTALGGNNLSYFQGNNRPIENVTWYEADAWARNNGFRLPSEAEWEFAARGGNRSKGYLYSGSNDLSAVGWHIDNSGNQTQHVGQKQPNELGIYDMSGNVFEWVMDWSSGYSDTPMTNPAGPDSGAFRVMRGGSSFRGDDGVHRTKFRYGEPPDKRANTLGFRVVLDSSL